MTNRDTLSDAVLDAVASQEDVPKIELRYPLFDAINTESLDSLFRNSIGYLVFEYHGYQVTITHEGEVALDSLESG